ncbi:TlpA family protein disulfide reductase [Aurantibacter crassamenti]|uniref:TlpA family protein disulfide reductase n=1 Tax=Aurantibacter crassamenti TaxID=1837375 RepID=UPI00193AA305|nr:TlpA disulfide reductase family protein [Aurantibacter crassamenti]MBM1106499.1 TlpA family protein disulfide reductase [Aurantibacter crassamenti]
MIKKKTVLNVLLIGLVLSFFVTPLGDFSKELLNKWFATSPTIISVNKQGKIDNYNWKLKDANWDFFNFKKSEGKVVFINFWTTWHLPSRAQLDDIQKLYDRYKGQVDFYIITDEEQSLPNEFMAKKGYTFPITYQIIDEPSPIKLLKPSGTYLLDKKGNIVIHQTAIADWDNNKVFELINRLLTEQ